MSFLCPSLRRWGRCAAHLLPGAPPLDGAEAGGRAVAGAPVPRSVVGPGEKVTWCDGATICKCARRPQRSPLEAL